MANILGSFCDGNSLSITTIDNRTISYSKEDIDTRISALPDGPFPAKVETVRLAIIAEIVAFVGAENIMPDEIALDLNKPMTLRIFQWLA